MQGMIGPLGLTAFVAAVLLPASGLEAQSISLRDSFRIGSEGAVLCTAQLSGRDPAASDMFDRAYAIVCRDAAAPVGHLYVLKSRGGDPAVRLASLRAGKAECQPAAREAIGELAAVESASCRMKDLDVGYRTYQWREGGTLYAAEGLAGYDSVLRLGLRTLAADRPVPGEVSIAMTEAGDPAAFARAQAGALDRSRALAEAYRRNNSGNFAEAAEFFGTLLEGEAGGGVEALVNQALQQSNLGNHVEADRLFAEAEERVGGDPVVARMFRNYRAMHLLNQGRPREAMAELDRPLPGAASGPSAQVAQLVIDARTAARLNAEGAMAHEISSSGAGLLPDEKIEILEGQAQQLRGTILRLEGRPDEAATAYNAGLARLTAVRGGRVTSTVWMRGQLLGGLADIAEDGGNAAEAEARHREAVDLIAAHYPGSAALLATQSRLAAFYARRGRTEPALALYRQIVDANAESGNSSPTLQRTLAPYFALLAAQDSPQAVADMFKASQLLVRPGVAQTQAVLARELSGGSDDAARLFRQSVNLTREIARARVEASRLSAIPQPTALEAARLSDLRRQLTQMERDQVATQAKLAEFPRYRVVSGGAMSLDELQKVLRDGEAYYKMVMVGDAAYAIFATPGSARAYRLGLTPGELERQVDALRDTISAVEENRVVTYPFDVALAHRLYGELFQPVAGELASVRHLVFEPDGAMLRLPPNLLVTDRAGVDAYLARTRRPGDEGFDFTGVQWLGRGRDVSTAVSARAFRDVRQVQRSGAKNDYIGFGENSAPGGAFRAESAFRRLTDPRAGCSWSIAEWGRPISSEELHTASQVLDGGAGGAIVTGDAFTDNGIKARDDLSQYRIMHFATHGLVTAPRPECPARPALMTSFGGGDSDGLLTFREIYDLRIDADLVILSACDTAGKASVAATREAGVTTGGDFALDGLVRAFVGAGGRSVIASHWPVPDDYDATKALISGLFTAPPGTATASALRAAQTRLMDQPATSHPYYWSGFAIIGDGAAPVIPQG